MTRKITVEIICTLLIALFIYAAFSKWVDMKAFSRAMYNQPFPHWASSFFIVSLPAIEVVISFLLIIGKTRQLGLIASAMLMSMFTIYISSILLHFFPRVPCSCGGVIRKLGWGQHLLFNLFFMAIAFWGISLNRKVSEQNSEQISDRELSEA
jgi:uncharacterized membrane protein YphA (DoxX/SURF4 family)